MSVYTEIIEWSKGIPDWQRDALRRLASGAIGDTELDEVEYLCLKPQGLKVPGHEDISPVPLNETHLPSTGTSDDAVSLISLSDVHGVNLISSTAFLQFGAAGLTIIYGYNGSGKSGYARILKRVCRARDGGTTICPNVFQDVDGSSPSAKISFTSGDVPTDHAWIQGQPAPADLGSIAIFDSSCAEFYVTKENDVAYRPFGLDLFDKLAATADAIRQRLETRKVALTLQCPPVPPLLLEAGEIAGIYPVTAKTSPQAIEAIKALTPGEEKELALLQRAADEENPIRKAAAIRARKGRLIGAADQANAIANVLNAAKVDEFKSHVDALKAAQAEARLVSNEAFKNMLPQTGGPAWKGLWDHARAFAAVAYAGEIFPNVGDDALCLLCQQPLGDEAKGRFTSFEAFVKQAAETKLAEAQSRVTADTAALKALDVAPPAEDIIQELRSHHEEWATKFAGYKSLGASAVSKLVEAFSNDSWEVAIPAFDVQPIRNAAQLLENEAVATLAPDNSEELAKRAARILSLEARKWIAANAEVMKADVVRAKQAEAITKAINTTSTTAISRKSTELTKSHVSDALALALESELTSINANHLHITLTSRSMKGTTFHRIDIKDRKVERINVKDIVSEGEFRAIAIAAFFAELGQGSTRSAIVVDDPVSSLDHLHRERVALRLVSEAKQRQVIVFTHEVLFLRHLIDEAIHRSVPLTLRQVTRGETEVGIVTPDIPWDTQKVKQRIHSLAQQLAEVKKVHASNHALYESAGKDWYGYLRETWESTIEEILFNGCIQRMRLSVETKRLEKVTITQADYTTIEAGMTKASRWFRGHSKPVGDTTPFPEPSDLEADLKILSDFVEVLRHRQK